MKIVEKLKTLKTSDTCFIIGGGPSLTTTIPDPSVLDNKDVICCNYGFVKFPKCLVTLFLDLAWYRDAKDKKLLQQYKGLLVAASGVNKKDYLVLNIDAVFNRGSDAGLSGADDTLCGSNTGHAAINLAVILGYKTIVLCGFDLDSSDQQTQWHTLHKAKTNTERYDTSFLPHLETVSSVLPSDVKIYNINPNSQLKAFEFVSIEKFL